MSLQNKTEQKSVDRQIISGALHYFRVHPELWADRLEKARAMGLNCIETYIPWNLHEPHRGEFEFSGICDTAGLTTGAKNTITALPQAAD